MRRSPQSVTPTVLAQTIAPLPLAGKVILVSPAADDELSIKVLLRAAVIGLLLAAAKPAVASTAQMLSYTMGQSIYAEVKHSLLQRGASPRDKGTSGHAGGPMLEASGRSIGVEGLYGAYMIFDAESRLAGGLLTLDKSRYDAVVQAPKQKYTLVREIRPFVGNRLAEFRADSAHITVDAPRLSFEMTVRYRTPTVKVSLESEAEAEAAERRRTDREQF